MDYELFMKLQNDKVSGAQLTQAQYDALPQAQKENGTVYFIDDGEGDDMSSFIRSGAGFHNSIYRGDYLGSEVTAEQYNQIEAGTFNDMYIGDYWTIGGVNYRIAAFDYWLHCGDTRCMNHHVLLVPDTCIGEDQKMNDSRTATGGYVGSKMYTTNLASAKSTISSAFGSAHILSHREILPNAIDSSGNASNWSWYDSSIELMNEQMVYGSPCGSKPAGDDSVNFNIGIDKSQLPLFALEPSRICNRASYWLRSVVSATSFSRVGDYGHASAIGAENASGVRPCFGLVKANPS